MNRADIDLLRDARQFALDAGDNAGGLSAEVLAFSKQPQHAALFDLVIIGEALNSAEIKSAAPQIEWRPIAALRNLIVHSYWQIDLEIIAYIVEKELDPLVAQLDNLIGLLERDHR